METLKPFRFWCQKVLPLVYDDSLSYYELLCKVVDHLNETIEQTNDLTENVNELTQAFNNLQTYVENYFNSVDWQSLVDNKLDEYAEDGTLTRLLGKALDIFISGDYVQTYFTNANGDSTNVYYRIIPSGYEPQLYYGNNVQHAEYFACYNGLTCCINAGRFSGDDFVGYTRVDGVTLHENDSPANSRGILGYKNEQLYAIDSTLSTEAIDGNNYEWAVTGFEAVILEGSPTTRSTPGNTESTDYQPRSFIAQNYDGSYIIGCTEGRLYNTAGFRLSDIYRFIMSLGLNTRFAYSLDGGGSVSLVEKGHRINKLINSEWRKIKTVIGFKKSNAYASDFLKSAYDSNQLFIRGDYRNAPLDGDIRNVYPNNATTTNIQNYKLTDEGSERTSSIRTQFERFYVVMENSFSSDNQAHALINITKTAFEYNQLIRSLLRADILTDDFTNELPTQAITNVWRIQVTSSEQAVSLGAAANDYGRWCYIRFRCGTNYDLILTRAHAYYRYDNGSFISLN